LRRIEERLLSAGISGFRFHIVGDGTERTWLRSHMKHADLPGVLRGEALARAYADMDVFVFPSNTDSFGNVVLEALASGVPVVVARGGGPKFLVEEGVSGFIAKNDNDFLDRLVKVLSSPSQLNAMKQHARSAALGA